jgi:hypothetical protein
MLFHHIHCNSKRSKSKNNTNQTIQVVTKIRINLTGQSSKFCWKTNALNELCTKNINKTNATMSIFSRAESFFFFFCLSVEQPCIESLNFEKAFHQYFYISTSFSIRVLRLLCDFPLLLSRFLDYHTKKKNMSESDEKLLNVALDCQEFTKFVLFSNFQLFFASSRNCQALNCHFSYKSDVNFCILAHKIVHYLMELL